MDDGDRSLMHDRRRYTDRELEGMLTGLESDRVEPKRSAADRRAIRRNVCAFANDLPGHGVPGVIVIGINDDGSCADTPIDDELLRNLAAIRDDGHTQPLPSITVERRWLSGCEVAVVTVEPSRYPPVRYQGRAFVRVGPTVRQANPEEEQILGERRLSGSRPFDLLPVLDARVEELDLDYLRAHYLPNAVAAEVLEANRRPLQQQLRSLRLMAGEHPTWGSVIGFGRNPLAWCPGAYVQFLRFDGSDVTDPILDQKHLSGRLEDVLRELDLILKLNVRVHTDITSRSREWRHADYPLPALQQLARNAVMHRRYEGTNAPVHLYWYTDRIESANPGSLYGRVRPDNFGHEVDYRNPLVAEIMHHLGFAQRFGVGVAIARRELEKNGNPEPGFDFRPTRVAVTLRPAS